MGLGLGTFFANRKWRKKNKHNYTNAGTVFKQDLVSVGKYSYGTLNIYTSTKESVLKIGAFCSIAPNVVFLLSSDHRIDTVSTYPFKFEFENGKEEAVSKGDILIEDDVWIGYGAVILSGVTIGQGAVVAAGAVVDKNVPPYAIVGGIPARVIKYRFPSELITEMVKIDFSKLEDKIIREHLEEFYVTIQNKKQIEWMPKRNN